MAFRHQTPRSRQSRQLRSSVDGTDVGDRHEQGVLTEVVDLPPGDLIKQTDSVPPWRAAADSTAYWSFLFCRPRNESGEREAVPTVTRKRP